MNQLRLVAVSVCCTVLVASVATAGPGGAGGGHGAAGGHATSGAGRANSARPMRYDNPDVLHYLQPASGYAFAKFEGCGSAKSKPGCVPTQAAELQSLRDRGLLLRQTDGGTLTPEHRAELQSKLDAIRTLPK
jgi:hypothetical protein